MKQFSVSAFVFVSVLFSFGQSVLANQTMNCLFIESIGWNPETQSKGHFNGPTAFHAHTLNISQLNENKIQINLINTGMKAVTWYGTPSLCRRVANEFPIANATCFDLSFSNHPQKNDGQLVIPIAGIENNSNFEIHSVNMIALPIGLIDITDRYSCSLE